MKSLESLSDLFNKYVFRIPEYQRGYAWKEKQIHDFWNDLMNLDISRNHYTGMISLETIDKHNDKQGWNSDDNWIFKYKEDACYVIDGQQRLTTSVILIFSILKFCRANNINNLNGISLDDIESKYIKVTQEGTIFNTLYVFSYINDKASKEHLEYKIFEKENPGELEQTVYTYNLDKAKEIFSSKLDELYTKSGNNIKVIEDLFSKLVNNFKYNVFEVNNDFDVYIAFETMNNRGKKLSTLELLKNRLLYLISVLSDNPSYQRQLRNRIISSWTEIYKQLGRNKDVKLSDEDYLRYHWNMYFPYTGTRGVNYVTDLLGRRFTLGSFRLNNDLIYLEEDIDNDDEVIEEDNFEVEEKKIKEEKKTKSWDVEIIEYVDSLKESAKYYYFINEPDSKVIGINISDEEKGWIKRIKRLGFVTFIPMIMSLLKHADKFSKDKRIELLETIENTIFIVYRCSEAFSTYKMNPIYTAARNLYYDANIDDCINTVKEILNHIKPRFGEYFKNKMSKSSGKGFYSWGELRYFLFEYEQHLREFDSQKRSFLLEDNYFLTSRDKDKVSIEHILPQTANETYGYWLNQVRGYTEKEINILTNSLGNLLPLSQSINSSLQNDSFEEKKKYRDGAIGYENGSLSEREVAKYDKWTPKSILDRGIKVLEFLEKHWDVKFYNRKPNETEEEYKNNRRQTMIDFLGLSFVNDKRDIPEEYIVIPKDEVVLYDDKDNKRNLSNVFNNYWVNLKYYKTVKKLKEYNIDFIQFNNWYGWADLLKVFDDGKYSKFATFRFRNQVDYLEVTLPKAKDNEIKQYIVNNDVDIEVVVNALLYAYNKETFGDNVTFKKITDTIEEMIQEGIESGKKELVISGRDVQNRLGLKNSGPRMYEALNSVFNKDYDVVIDETLKNRLVYSIKFDLNYRKK